MVTLNREMEGKMEDWSEVSKVFALMEKYGIEDLAEFIQSYAHLHVESNEEMKLYAQIESGHLDR
jgi:hypothetical protein